MTSVDGPSPSPGNRGLLRLFRFRKPTAHFTDQSPLILSSPPPETSAHRRNKVFASMALSGLGCASAAASQAYAPSSAAAAVRSSANWEVKCPRRRRSNMKKKERRRQPPSLTAVASSTDLCCAPGIPFVTGDDSMDCVVSHREVVGRGAGQDSERIPRERPCSGRRAGNREQISSMAETLSSLEATDFGSELLPSARYHRMRGYYHRPAAELEEIMLFQRRIMLQGGDAYDRYRDWRLDVDNMTYEELLELGDKIGYVSTGLGEEEIAATIRKVKHSIFDTDFSTELARKCSICQEEYQTDDELGTLRCGHGYHIYCIKKWLLQKNACPVCKTIARKP